MMQPREAGPPEHELKLPELWAYISSPLTKTIVMVCFTCTESQLMQIPKKPDNKHLPLTHAHVCNPAKQGKENPDSRGD